MNRTIEDIQKDIELLGIKGGYDIEQLLTPQDCRRLSYEIERLNNIIKDIEKCIDYYAIENDDFSKFYNNEEIEILKIIGSDKE